MKKQFSIPNSKRLGLTLAFLVFCSSLFAQKSVTGVVQDANGETLPGVTVMVKEVPTAGTISDFDGKYQISIPKGGKTLVFSFVGFKNKEVAIAGKSSVNVTLEIDAVGLEEVQVVAYGAQKKITVTGAISSIREEDLGESPSATVANALSGKLTGVTSVQTSGEPGSDVADIYVRGMATWNDARPLMIVDGVERDFTQLDPEEIASVNILKDASATAVYGIRGANGVIIVNTKRGKAGKMSISVSSQYGLQQPTKLVDKADSYTYALAYNERETTDGRATVFTPEILETFKNGGNLVYPNTDWYDVTMNKVAPQTKHNISMRGGNEKIKYYVNLGYFSQDGLFKTLDIDEYNGNFKFQRYNFRTNIDFQLAKGSVIKLTVGGRSEKRNSPRTSDAGIWKELIWAQPFSGSGVVDGKWVGVAKSVPGTGTFDFKDPLRAYYGRGIQEKNRNALNIDLEYTQDLDFITKGLKFNIKGSYNNQYDHNVIRDYQMARYEANYLMDDTRPVLDSNNDPIIVLSQTTDPSTMEYMSSYGKARNWYMQANLNYSRRVGNHNVGGMLLLNQMKTYYPVDQRWNPTDFQDVPRAIRGFAARVTYDYLSKYLLNIDMGYNGSENFHPDKRYGFFPAASIGWVISEEDFMKKVTFLDFMKIRGSVGLVGNDRPGVQVNAEGEAREPRFLYQDTKWNSSAGYNFGFDNRTNQQGVYEGIYGNPGLGWEVALKQNYGIDAKFFNSRLDLRFDFFMEDRSEILMYRNTLPSIVGANLPVVNLGEVKNKGFELELTWRDKIKPGMNYFISANMSYAKNEIVFADEITKEEEYMYMEGNPINQPFGYKFDGFFSDEILTDGNYPTQAGSMKAGYTMYRDLNNDGMVDYRDMSPIGYTNVPEITFGTRMGFDYKGFSFNMSWVGATNVSRELTQTLREPFGNGDRALLQFQYDGRWTPETASSAKYPILSTAGKVNNYQDSDLWMMDASYIRLKSAEIAYNFKLKKLRKLGVKNLRVYVNGFNLLTFDNMKFIDPEAPSNSEGSYPIVKVYNAGVRFNF